MCLAERTWTSNAFVISSIGLPWAISSLSYATLYDAFKHSSDKHCFHISTRFDYRAVCLSKQLWKSCAAFVMCYPKREFGFQKCYRSSLCQGRRQIGHTHIVSHSTIYTENYVGRFECWLFSIFRLISESVNKRLHSLAYPLDGAFGRSDNVSAVVFDMFVSSFYRTFKVDSLLCTHSSSDNGPFSTATTGDIIRFRI